MLPFITIFLAGIFLPKLLIKNKVSSQDAVYPRKLAYQVLNNPFDRILTLTTSVKQTDEEHWLVTAHTFAGIKYATILVNQDGSASLVSKLLLKEVNNEAIVTTFEDCAAAGYPVVESYPRRCLTDEREFIEDISSPTGPLPPVVSEVCRSDQECDQGYYCKSGLCESTGRLCSGETQACGGIAGILCCGGLKCELEGNFPDAGGTCVVGEDVVCSMEAKLCPNGSYVGRTGPNCEFSSCPGEQRDLLFPEKNS